MNSSSIAADLAELADKRIVFAHQSVGNDILEGVRSLASRQGSTLNITEERSAPADWKGIAHFKVGLNGDPQGKIADFADAMGSNAFPAADVAIFKLCYIDFDDSAADPAKLAKSYGDTLERLQAQFPATRFVASTAPLTTIQTGPKAWVKKLLGRTPSGYEENFRRHVFNEQLRSRFGSDRLFDIAKLEASGGGNHSPTVFEFKSQRIEALDPALTYDGGHLDDAGKAAVAAQFVKFIAGLPAPVQ